MREPRIVDANAALKSHPEVALVSPVRCASMAGVSLDSLPVLEPPRLPKTPAPATHNISLVALLRMMANRSAAAPAGGRGQAGQKPTRFRGKGASSERAIAYGQGHSQVNGCGLAAWSSADQGTVKKGLGSSRVDGFLGFSSAEGGRVSLPCVPVGAWWGKEKKGISNQPSEVY
jgi:hypothetical protein